MRRTSVLPLAVALAGCLLWLGGCGSKKDTKENREAAAKDYLEACPMKEMADDAARKISVKLPESQREQFVDFVTDKIRLDRLEKANTDTMTKVFTVEEIKALTEFYKSKEGRSIQKKYGDYMAEVFPVILEEVRLAAQGFRRETPDETDVSQDTIAPSDSGQDVRQPSPAPAQTAPAKQSPRLPREE